MARWVLAAALAAAIGAGWWLLQGPHGAPRAGPQAGTLAPNPRGAGPATPADLPTPAPRTGTPPTEAPAATTGGEAAPPQGSHPGVVVVGPSGRPVSGAHVTAAVSRDRFKTCDTVQVVTGPDGRLPATWPQDAWVVLDVRADGMVPEVLAITSPDTEPARVSLREGGPFRCTVLDLHGKPVASERVRLVPIVPQTSLTDRVLSRLPLVDAEATTDGEGRFTASALRPGAYRVLWPDHPKLPAAVVRAEDVEAGSATVRIPK